MNAETLLAECAAEGIAIIRDGDDLRIRASSSADLTALVALVQAHKSELHEALLRQEIMALAYGPTDAFDRSRFNARYAEWEQRYRIPREAQGGSACLE